MIPSKGTLRLFSDKAPDSAKNLWQRPNILLQKLSAMDLQATTKLAFTPNEKLENEEAGLTIMGLSYAKIAVKSRKDGIYLVYAECRNADKNNPEKETVIKKLVDKTIYLRVVIRDGQCRFSYSADGINFNMWDQQFTAEPGRWIGAKVGIFCIRSTQTNDAGYADFDWFRVERIE